MADQRPCKLSFESSPLAESTHRSSAVWASRKGRDIGPPAPNDNSHRQTSFLETSCPETTCQTKTRCTPPSPPSSRAAWPLSFVVSPSSRVWTTRRLSLLPVMPRQFWQASVLEAERRLARGGITKQIQLYRPEHYWCTTTGVDRARVFFACVCVCCSCGTRQAIRPSRQSTFGSHEKNARHI